jgi:uncharacterized protein (TIGR00369 family)
MSDNQVSTQDSDGPATNTVDPALLESLARGALTDLMGVRLIHAAPDLMIGTMPVEGNTQPYGLLHGGASCVLAESLGSVGAALHGAQFGKIPVGVEINATHHRGATSGLVTGTARPLHLGSTLATYEVVIVDEQARRICTARLTCLLRPAPPAPRD